MLPIIIKMRSRGRTQAFRIADWFRAVRRPRTINEISMTKN